MPLFFNLLKINEI